jgi:hypothetical protein
MKNWNLLFRRTHLYLGMVLLPWVSMYAVSTFLLNHGEHFRPRPADQQWQFLWEKDYALEVPPGNDALRDTARRVLTDNGLSGAFGVQRQGPRLNINVQNFFAPTRVTYDVAGKKLRTETRKHTWAEVLIRLHERTGYGRGGFLHDLWAFAVDVFCVTTLVWIGTGVYLWWKISGTRGWGFLAIGGGVATIAILLASL